MRHETALDRFKATLDELGIPWEKDKQGLARIERGGFKWWVGNAMPQNDPTLTRLVVGCCYPTQEEALELMGIEVGE